MKVCFSRCRVRTQVIISSRVHVSGTAAARAPGMGENPVERFSSPARCPKTLDIYIIPIPILLILSSAFLVLVLLYRYKHCLLPSYNKVTLS